MMRRINFIVLAAGIWAIFGALSANAQLKLAYINSGRVMAENKQFQAIAKQLQDLTEQYEKEMRQMEQELEESQKAFENQQLLLSEDRRAQKQREIQEKYQKALQFQNEKFGQQGEVAQKRQELTEPMIKKVQELLEKIGKAENYDIIFDTVNGNIVYAKEGKYDITDQVLKELEKSPVTTTATPVKK